MLFDNEAKRPIANAEEKLEIKGLDDDSQPVLGNTIAEILAAAHRNTADQRRKVGDETDSAHQHLLDIDDAVDQQPERLRAGNTSKILAELTQTRHDLRKKHCKQYARPAIVAAATMLSLGTIITLGIKYTNIKGSELDDTKKRLFDNIDQYKVTPANSTHPGTCNDLYDLSKVFYDGNGVLTLQNNPCKTENFVNILTQICMELAAEICASYNDERNKDGQVGLLILGLAISIAMLLGSLLALRHTYKTYYSTPAIMPAAEEVAETKREHEPTPADERIVTTARKYHLPIHASPYEIAKATKKK